MESNNGLAGKYTLPLVVLTALFFMWGFITVLVDALIPRLRDIFELTYFQAGLVQFSFFMAYFLVSIPSGFLISRIGYKWGVVTGLGAMCAACLMFLPAAELRVFGLFLMALFVLASGITILQVAANPFVAALGPEKTSSSRLNLSQAFNSLGTTLAPLVSAAFILDAAVLTSAEISALSPPEQDTYFATEASAVQLPFMVLAGVLLVMALFFAFFRLPAILTDDERTGSYKTALSHKPLVFGALGIFVYVGAEVAIGSYLVNYFLTLDFSALVADNRVMSALAAFLSGGDPGRLNPVRLAGTFVVCYWGGAMVGRFVGAYLLQFIRPGRLLAVYGAVNIGLLLLTMSTGGLFAVWTVLAIGLFNSIMFPTIFTLAIKGLGLSTAQGSGVLCTAIVGGAIIPPLFGAVADWAGLQTAFIVPMLCYAYISWYGAKGSGPG